MTTPRKIAEARQDGYNSGVRVRCAADVARLTELEAALRPFAESHPAECVDEHGWTTNVHRDPISTWFGPSDFRAARAALSKST